MMWYVGYRIGRPILEIYICKMALRLLDLEFWWVLGKVVT